MPAKFDGDWTCTNAKCNNLNFARRTECNKCGEPRDYRQLKKKVATIGKHEAQKSGGLFSADDWRCTKCGNINWNRRSHCNVCNAAKLVDEERTGYGGGFNDRQNVEYIERDESDNEIDEFGRKKKKFRAQQQNEAKSEDLPLEDGEEGDDLDEEEDDDDESLSKYDLTDSDDNSNSSESSARRSFSSSSSRSRSPPGSSSKTKTRKRRHHRRSRSRSSSSSSRERSKRRSRRN